MNHPDPEVDRLLTKLSDALCKWERSTGRQSLLALREQGGTVFRAVSGKPLSVHYDLSDQHILNAAGIEEGEDA